MYPFSVAALASERQQVAVNRVPPRKKEPPPIEVASFVFPDIRAIYNADLESFPKISYDETSIHGFEIYLVEQWAAERKYGTVITSYTGNSKDVVTAIRVILPKNVELWPRRMQIYYQQLVKFARPKVIHDSTLFTTDLSSFPSTVNLLHVECGDIRKIWSNFKTNYGLKRLRCGGRSALLLDKPSTAAADKFAQLYKIPVKHQHSKFTIDMDFTDQYQNNQGSESDDIKPETDTLDLHDVPVIELVTLVQTSLSYFALFPFINERDGLLCNYTKQGITLWWEKYGKFYLGMERPKNEATMGPTTVAGLISLVLTCYFKLMVEDSMPAKDPFDEDDFYSGIYSFQKKHNFSNSHKMVVLDEQTLSKLFEVSSRASNTDIFKFRRVLKSTVQDFTGKGNFMQLSSEILTTDLETLIQNIHGGTLALLWKRKEKSRKEIRKIRKRGFTKFTFHQGDPEDQLKQQNIYFNANSSNSKRPMSLLSQNVLEDESVYDIQGLKSPSESLNQLEDPIVSLRTNAFYKKEFFRRKSFSSIESDVLPSKSLHSLHRSNSMSEISDSIEIWNLPFDPSLVRIVRDIIRIRNQLANKSIPFCSDFSGETECLTEFNEKTLRMQKKYVQCIRSNNDLKSKHEMLQTKQHILSKEMQELKSLASQFKYNIRILHTRMRDVEASVDGFDRKLNNIMKNIAKQDSDMITKLDPVNDKETFDKYVRTLLKSENTKYEGFWVRTLGNHILGSNWKEQLGELGSWIVESIHS
ncbi:hypothetical protein KAFR_0C04090 [Kazachstania africana CBS 2517]|uniref:STB6-like N-terminal domain-containing protein n=1 Tax=Kazachstania africana (strain ATCC 22294 / BCRC 22015 / CBS 2517 / CECT 1963 / NBRC 1671 / NRRL Y-8276) TaxID=1071382 RepID=H2ASQ0_KAZAF|nr:hypothetical protein KAFR_0C04090 [Kazachstania africana CBS 2517]CCF57400.1 hypothetical protein KAFR_0C04090 [Kazachstania africana CBS 2517]